MPPKSKNRLVACPVCSSPLAAKSKVCANCGAELDERMNPICPNCGTTLDPGTSVCKSCYTNLKNRLLGKAQDRANRATDDLLEITPLAGPKEEVEVHGGTVTRDMRFSCPKCDLLLSSNEESCPRCKTWLGGETGYQCPLCGAGVNPLMAKCPDCGLEFIESEPREAKSPRPAEVPPKTSEADAECPTCGKVVRLTNSHCPHCGVEFEPDEEPGAQEAEAGKAVEEEVACPICEKSVGADVSICPFCGAEFEAEELPQAECPVCHESVGLTVSRCPHCGTDFQSEAEEKAEPAEEPHEPSELVLGLEAAVGRIVRPVDLKVIIGFAAFGAIMLLLAYLAQARVEGIASAAADAGRLPALEGQRNLYLVTAICSLFLALFGASLPAERVVPAEVMRDQMYSTAKVMEDYCSGRSLGGKAQYLPARNGLTRERVFVPVSPDTSPPVNGLSDGQTVLSTDSGELAGILVEPLGLGLLYRIEKELGVGISDSGLDAAEGSLQMLKNDLKIMKDFHFKKRGERTLLRVEYDGLAGTCRAVRKERPGTCSHISCIGCACLLTAAARATGKIVRVEGVESLPDRVTFELSLHDW